MGTLQNWEVGRNPTEALSHPKDFNPPFNGADPKLKF